MNRLLLSVKILKSGNLIEKLVFNEIPETENQIKYMGIIKIGKMSTSHIKLNDAFVSRMHAIIENIDEKFYFTFMGKGETLLNEKAIEQNEKLELLDKAIVKIGDLSLKFYLGLDIFDSEEGLEEGIVQAAIEDDVREITPEEESEVFTPVESLLIEDDISTSLSVLNIKERRARDKDIYFNNSVEDEIMLKESIGKGIEVKHYWRGNLVESKLFSNKADIVTIGAEESDTFFIDKKLLPNEKSFKILENMGEVYFLKDNVKYIEGEDIYELEELLQAQKAIDKGLSGAIRLLFRTKIAFEIGDNRIEISHIPLYKTAGKSILAPILDGLNVKFSTLAAIVHFLIIFVIYLIPADIQTFNIEKLNKIPELYVSVILDVPKPKKIIKKVVFKKKVTDNSVKFNKNAVSDYSFSSRNVAQKLSKRKQKTKDLIKNEGMLGLKKGIGKGLGNGAYKGMEDDDIKLDEATDVTASNSGYSGIRGGASGPGGTGSSIGTSGPSTAGYRARSLRNRIGGINGGKRKTRGIIGTTGKPVISNGSLSRSQIQRVISKGLSQIRYCYEKALLRSPKLKGNVTLSWRITPQGKVISVKIDGATLKNNSVHLCMKAKVKNWRFPEPKGGGYAQVKYPFNFRSN